MDVHEAAYRVAHDFKGGVPALAARMGRNPGTLFNQLNPNVETHPLALGAAVEMTVITGDLRILEAFAATCDCSVVPLKGLSQVSDSALLDLVAKWMSEQGRFFDKFHETLSDKRVTDTEFKETDAQARRVISALLELLNRLSQLVEAES